LSIESEQVTTRSFVRTIDPGLGMGIEFIGLRPEDQQRFQEYLKALNPWGCSIERPRKTLLPRTSEPDDRAKGLRGNREQIEWG